MVGQLVESLLLETLTFRRGFVEKASFISLNILDLVLTLVASYLNLSELNPLMTIILGIPGLIILCKIVLPVIIAWLIPGKWLWPAIIMMFLVVSWNIKELLIFSL